MPRQSRRTTTESRPKTLECKKRKRPPMVERQEKPAAKPPRKGNDPWRSRKQSLKNIDVDDLQDYLLDQDI